MINKYLYFLFFILSASSGFSQNITGIVYDAKTKELIESASVYFDNTTIGTTTNAKGEFSIPYNTNIKSPLIISFLGYQKIILGGYSPNNIYKLELQEDINTLDEVLITDDDGMSRRLKLSQFKKQFLGSSRNAQSCKILNKDDIILRYFKKDMQLIASSRKPIIIENRKLQYRIAFEINDFKIHYRHLNIEEGKFNLKSVIYSGTSKYENLNVNNKEKIIKKRQETYKGSTLHFMRALSKKALEEEAYEVFNKGFIVNPYDFFTVTSNKNSRLTTVKLKNKVIIRYAKKQSSIESRVETFTIDQYGNHTPIDKVIFTGEMGNQRLGDSLPLDYDINED